MPSHRVRPHRAFRLKPNYSWGSLALAGALGLCSVRVLGAIQPVAGGFLFTNAEGTVLISDTNGSILSVTAGSGVVATGGESGLWSLTYTNTILQTNGIIRASDFSSTSPSNTFQWTMGPSSNSLLLAYSNAAVTVNVTVTDRSDGVDLKAEVAPRTHTVLGISLPARLRFATGSMERFIAPSHTSDGVGTAYTPEFFQIQEEDTPASWNQVRNMGPGPYISLYGAGLAANEIYTPTSLTFTADAAVWLGSAVTSRYPNASAIVHRPPAAGQADVVLIDSPRGPFFSGSHLPAFGGGSNPGWLMRIGGLIDASRVPFALDVVVGAIEHLAQTPGGRTNVAVLSMARGPALGEKWPSEVPIYSWVQRLQSSTNLTAQGIRVIELTNVPEVTAALAATNYLAILNPYGELLPGSLAGGVSATVSNIGHFVRAGGNWFEVAGYSFYQWLQPELYYTNDLPYPPLFADFQQLETTNGNAAVFGVQPVPADPWSGQTNAATLFVPGRLAWGGDAAGGYWGRAFGTYVPTNTTWQSPVARLLLGQPVEVALQAYAQANDFNRALPDKMSPAMLDTFKQGVMIHYKGNATQLTARLPQLPASALLHFEEYLYGGFDKQYPDHLPPNPSFGTPAEFTNFLGQARAAGHLTMPYTNPTFWGVDPKGPTFLAAGDAPLLINLDGTLNYEEYFGEGGMTVTPWHPAVQAANRSTRDQFITNYPVDILFQDQIGARTWQYDLNSSSPTPYAYLSGLVAIAGEDSQSIPLSTENGYDRLINHEAQFSGFAWGLAPTINAPSWRRYLRDRYATWTWNVFPLAQHLAHDKVSFIYNNLSAAVHNHEVMAWTLGLGYGMTYVVRAVDLDQINTRQWLLWIDRIQKSVAARYIGEPVTSFNHQWGTNAVNPDNGMMEAGYGDVEVLSNLGPEPLAANGWTLPAYGYVATAPGLVAGHLVPPGGSNAAPFVAETNSNGGVDFWIYAEGNRNVTLVLPSGFDGPGTVQVDGQDSVQGLVTSNLLTVALGSAPTSTNAYLWHGTLLGSSHPTLLVDFGPTNGVDGDATVSPDYLGQTWNNLRAPTNSVILPSVSLANLVTTSNVPTTISLTSGATGWNANGILNGGLLAPSFALLGHFAVTNATKDYFFTQSSASLTLSNLDATANYRLRFFGTRDTTISRVTRYVTTGGNGPFTNDLTTSGTGIGSGGYNGNNNTIATVAGVTPNASHQIQVSVIAQTGGFGYLGILEITANQAPTAVADTFSRLAGDPITISNSVLLANDTDPNHDPLTLTGFGSLPPGASTNATSITLPATNATVSFTYTISDGFGGTSTGSVTVLMKSANPTSATASATSIPVGGSTTLSLLGGGGGTGETIRWYSGSCGGTLVGSGNGLSVSPAATTTYYGRYEQDPPLGATACAAVTVTVTVGGHSTLLVDFGPTNGVDGDATVSPDYLGQTWNNLRAPTNGAALPSVSLPDLVTTGNVPTAIGLTSGATGWNANGILNGGLLGPSFALLGNFAVTNATKDYFFTQSSATLTLTNLSATANYRLRFFGTRETTSARTTRYITTGGNGSFTNDLVTSGTGIGSGGYDGNNHTIATVGGVTPNASNQILVSVIAQSGGFGYLGVMEIADNRAPTAVADSFTRGDGSPITITDAQLLANDTDPEGDTLSLVGFGSLPPGATTNATSITLPGTNATVSFTYSITDSYGGTAVGTGTVQISASPEIGLLGTSGAAIADGDSTPSLTDGTDFGSVPVVDGVAASVFTITNSGSATLTLSTPAISGGAAADFAVLVPPAATVAPGAATTFTLRFNPSANGIRQATVSIGNNDADENPYDFAVQGTGASPAISVSPASLNFVTQLEVSPPSQSFALTNSGLATLYYVITTNAGWLSVSPASGVLAAGAGQSITVSANASGLPVGVTNALITITDGNAVNSPQTVNVSLSIESSQLRLLVYGSSVAKGWNGGGSLTNGSYAGGYAGLLTTSMASPPWTVTNASVGGDSTADALARFDTDAVPANPDIILIGLSLGNEGLATGHNCSVSSESFQSGLSNLIHRSRTHGFYPVVTLSYPNDFYTLDDYDCLKRMNLLMNTWDLPSVNLLGAVDDGQGKWAAGYRNGVDNAHPNAAGHLEMFYAIVPSLFDAIASGKTHSPSFAGTPGFARLQGAVAQPMAFTPSATMHSFNLAFRVRTEATGTVAAVMTSTGSPPTAPATFLVDFGPNDVTNGDITLSPNYLGQYWNNLVGAGGGGGLPALGLANLVATNNSASTLGLVTSSTGWGANGKLNGGLLTPSFTLLGNFAVTNATEDYFTTTSSASLTLTNLNPSATYRLRFFGTRDSTISRVTRYITTGGNGAFTNDLTTSGTGIGSGGVNYNNNTIASVSGVTPNASNQIQVSVIAQTGGFGYLGILEIQETPATLPPEGGTIEIRDQQLTYVAKNGQQIAAAIDANDGSWTDVALSHSYARGLTLLYVDGVLAGTVSESLVPVKFVLGGPGELAGRPTAPTSVDLQDWCVYRAPWTPDEALAQHQGQLQQASMELGAPLNDPAFPQGGSASNRAQSLSQSVVSGSNVVAGTAALPPGNLQAVAVTANTVRLTWVDNSTTETGFVVERRPVGATAFWSNIVLLASGSTSYTNTGVPAGIYEYRVSSQEGSVQSDYSNIASALVSNASGGPTQAVFLVDFGPNDVTNGDATLSPDYLGQHWNNLVGAPGGGTLPALGLSNLTKANGGAGTIGLTSSATGWGANGKLNGGLLTPSYVLLGNFAVTNATEDYFTTTTSASLTLTNLNPAATYRLRFFGTRDTTTSRVTRYITTGGNGPFTNDLTTSGTGIGSGGVNYNNNTIATVGGVTPNASDQIQVSVIAQSGGFGYLGILEIEETLPAGSNAPSIHVSPSSLSFFGTQGGSSPASQSFGLTNVGTAVLNYTVATNANWVSVAPASGSLAAGAGQQMTVAVNTAGLPVGVTNALITITDSNAVNSPQTVAVSLTITNGACPTITLSPAVLTYAISNLTYNAQTITASGGTAPYSYAVTGGALPAGLTLSTNGVLSGTPMGTVGTYGFSVTATDANGCPGVQSYAIDLQARVFAVTPYAAVSPFTLDTATANCSISGSTNAVTYGSISIIIPPGTPYPAPSGVYQNERWGPSTYTFSGLTPGAEYNVRLHFAENWFGPPPHGGGGGAGTRVFNVNLNGTPFLTNFDVFVAAGNASDTAVIRETLAAANGSGQMVVSFVNTVPQQDNAKIAGIEILQVPPCTLTPILQTVSGTTNVCGGGTATVAMSGSEVGVTYELYGETNLVNSWVGDGQPKTWQVSPSATTTYTVKTPRTGAYCAATMNGSATVSVLGVANPAGQGWVGLPFSQMLLGTNGTPPYTFAAVSGMPPGLGITSSGLITGTPTTVGLGIDASGMVTGTVNSVGTFQVTVTVQDAVSCLATSTLSLRISPTFAVFGSSLAKGFRSSGWNSGTFNPFDSATFGWASWLDASLLARGYVCTNVSLPGDSTGSAINRFFSGTVNTNNHTGGAVYPASPKYVLISYSLGNDGMWDSGLNPDSILVGFTNNLAALVQQCRTNGFVPILGLAYARNDVATLGRYSYTQVANLILNQWNVPSFNIDGAIATVAGRLPAWADYGDGTHPNDYGYREIAYAFVPSLPAAIAAGKTNSPSFASPTNFARLTYSGGVNAPLTFAPSDTVHSFTKAFRVRTTGTGTIAAVRSGANYATLQVQNGNFVYVGTNGTSQIVSSGITATDGAWHEIAIVSRYVLTSTWLYVDGVLAGTLTEQHVPDEFILGGPGGSGRAAPPSQADFKNWCVYRSAWNGVEAAAQAQGQLQQASMEIGAMLDDVSFTSGAAASNRAQSLSLAMVNTTGLAASQGVPSPLNLTAQVVSVSSAALGWTWNGSGQTGFVVQRRLSGTSSWTDLATVAANITTYTNVGLGGGVSYDYRVAALEGALRGEYSNIAAISVGSSAHPTLLVDFGPNDATNGDVTSSPDYMGQHWNNFVGAGGGSGLPGLGLANLATTNNTATTIGLTSSASGWAANGKLSGGLLGPSQGLLGNFAVTNASQDFFFTTASASLTLTNLDPTATYRLRFFGTRETTSARTTRYVTTGGNGPFTNDLATSGSGIGSGGYNGNNNTIVSAGAVTPNGSNQIQVNVIAQSGGFGYLGILEILVNRRPTASNDTFARVTGHPITLTDVQLLANDTDVDEDALSLVGFGSLPPGATTNATSITLPATNTTVSFTYTLHDGFGGASTGTVTVLLQSAPPTSATAGSSSIPQGGSTTLTLVGGGGGSGETIRWYSGSCGGTLVGSGNGLSVSPAATTTYYGRYEQDPPLGATACAAVTVSITGHATLLVDFGPTNGVDGDATASPDYLGQTWNNLRAPTNGTILPSVSLAGLVTTSNVPTSISLTSGAGGWNANGTLNGGLLAPSFALLGHVAVTNATKDYFFTQSSATLTLANLDASANYRIRFFGTRDTTISRVTRYITTGGNGSFTNDLTTSGTGIGSGGYNGNNNTLATVSGVTPNGGQQIVVSVIAQTGGFGYLGLLEITDNRAPTAVPDNFTRNVADPITITQAQLLANDTDPDGDTLSLLGFGSLPPGATTNATSITLPSGAGDQTFTYTIGDGFGGTGTATGTVLALVSPTLVITQISRVGNDIRVTWTGTGGFTNQLQATTNNIRHGVTTLFADRGTALVLPGTSDISTNYLDQSIDTNLNSRFYRIRLGP